MRISERYVYHLIRQLALPALAYTTRLDIPSKRSLHPDCQRTCPGLNARASQSVCAQIIQSGGSGRTRTTGLALIRGAL